jgi:hypothetical protein
VSRFPEQPTEEHLQTVKKILCYVARMLEYGLRYGRRTGNAGLVGYYDSDLTDDIDTRKSTTGVLFFLGNCLVSWQSLKQRVVALSSYEAEYIMTTTATTQAIWMAWLLGELLGRELEVLELKVDNKPALELARNHIDHEHRKHIDLRFHFIQNCLVDRTVSATYINTADHLPDILMMALGRVKLQELRARIGMVQIGRERDQGEIDRDNPLSQPYR